MAAASAKDIAAFLLSPDSPGTDGIAGRTASAKLHAAPSWLTHATPEQLVKFQSDGFNIFSATIGPTDTLYMPSGYVVTHRAFPGDDVVGFKCGTLHPSDLLVLPLAIRALASAGKQCAAKNEAIDFMKKVLKWETPGEQQIAAANAEAAAKPVDDAARTQRTAEALAAGAGVGDSSASATANNLEEQPAGEAHADRQLKECPVDVLAANLTEAQKKAQEAQAEAAAAAEKEEKAKAEAAAAAEKEEKAKAEAATAAEKEEQAKAEAATAEKEEKEKAEAAAAAKKEEKEKAEAAAAAEAKKKQATEASTKAGGKKVTKTT